MPSTLTMKKKLTKDFTKDYYKGLKGMYFYKILKTIIKIGNLRGRNIKILDFGSSIGKLKKIFGNKVINYDILPELTDIKDWKKAKFEVVVANEVFYLFTKKELLNFLDELHKNNPKAELIVGISNQGILNKILMVLSNQFDAHADTILNPKEEINTLKQRMNIIRKKNVFFMCDVYLMKFKA